MSQGLESLLQCRGTRSATRTMKLLVSTSELLEATCAWSPSSLKSSHRRRKKPEHHSEKQPPPSEIRNPAHGELQTVTKTKKRFFKVSQFHWRCSVATGGRGRGKGAQVSEDKVSPATTWLGEATCCPTSESAGSNNTSCLGPPGELAQLSGL